MARYEDDGIEFAQQQFDRARDYREQQAKKQEKFAKKMQLANLAVSGVNFVLNQKADALETSRATQRAHYLTQLENSKGWQAMVKGYNDKGIYNRGEMLYQETFNNLRTKVQDRFGTDYDISVYNDTLEDLARQYSSDKDNLDSWNKTVDAYLSIPNLSQEDMIARIQQEGAEPRSIGAWFGNKLTKIAKSHDEQTMNAADRRAKDRMLGGLIGEQFKAAKDAIAEYGQTSGKPISALVEFMKTDKGKELASKVTKDAKFVVKDRQVEDEFGNTVKVQSQGVVGIGQGDRGAVELGDFIDVQVLEKKAPEKMPTKEEKQQIGSQISTFVKDLNKPDINDEYQKYLKAENESGLILNVDKTAKFLQRQYGVPQSLAISMGTLHILNQPQPFKNTTVSQYDFDKLRESVNEGEVGFVDTDKLNLYIQDIIKTKPDTSIPELTMLYKDMIVGIKQLEKTDEEKLGELMQLNRLLSDYIPSQIKSPESILAKPAPKPEQDLFKGSLPEGTVLDEDDKIVIPPLILSP